VSLIVAGMGFRRLGIAISIIVGSAAVAGVAAWFLGVMLGLLLGGRGEGAGVAAILAGFVLSGVVVLLVVVAGLVWIILRRRRVLLRSGRDLRLLGGGVLLVLLAAGMAGRHYVHVTPAAQSSQSLSTGMLAGYDGPRRAEAREELLARGQDAVPAVIAALRGADTANLREFESGLNGPVVWQIEVLGKLGGPDAIAELRTWLNGDYAEDIRAAAASALGEAGDRESAHAIALLLEEQSYEWRKCRVQLLYALRMLEARDELPYVRSALQFAPEEEGQSYQIMVLDAGIRTLVAFDTPEAWQVINEVANAGGEGRKQRVQYILETLGRQLPEAEGSVP
jgi:hypothetical protein